MMKPKLLPSILTISLLALPPIITGQVTFCVFGDLPYNNDEKDNQFPDQIHRSLTAQQNAQKCQFLMHVGDIGRPSNSKCSLTHYEYVRSELLKSSIPVFLTIGDNDANDCGRYKTPEEAWGIWESHFLSGFEDHPTRGWRNHPFDSHTVYRQEGREENFAFLYNGVLFVSVHIIAGEDKFTDTNLQREEILEDDVDWVFENLDRSEFENLYDNIIIFGHARGSVNRDFFDPVVEEIERLNIPTYYVTGNGHDYDHGSFGNGVMKWVQVDRGRDSPPLKITVNSNGKFGFDPPLPGTKRYRRGRKPKRMRVHDRFGDA